MLGSTFQNLCENIYPFDLLVTVQVQFQGGLAAHLCHTPHHCTQSGNLQILHMSHNIKKSGVTEDIL